MTTMQTLSSITQLDQLKSDGALLILFGGAHCGVCQSIKPKIETLMTEQFPDIALAYVDCEQSPAICAQHSVFSLPVIKLYIEDQMYFELVRGFSLHELTSQVDRIYRLWKAS
ncbi:MAG: thioredoxin family protein [Sedimenticola sp.]|nr:thioredoxin family protein [Sedimenticola sp.]